MKTSGPAAMRRIFFLLLIVSVAALAWDNSRNSDLQRVINTLNGRYGITLSFAMLLLLFFVIVVKAARNRVESRPH